MVEALINATVIALREPANKDNGIRAAVLKFLKPAFTEGGDYRKLAADPAGDEAEEMIHARLDDYLTGEPDRIEELEDILDRQDGMILE